MILTMSEDNGLLKVTNDRHVPGDSNTTDDGGSGPGNPNPLIPKGPRDLNRSRRIGLSRVVCTVCRSSRDQGLTVHKPGCDVDEKHEQYGTPKWVREVTGPLAKNQTSRDAEWVPRG